MANSTIVCRDVSTTDELTENHPQSNLPFLAAGMRPRGLSLRSGPPMPTVPENSPERANSAAPSIAGGSTTGSVGERLIHPVAARLEYLQRERPGTFWEQDTTVPENTPVSTGNLRPVTQGLPAIEELLPHLPPPRRDTRSTDGACDADHESVHSLNVSSLRSEYGTPSPNTVVAPPPTPATRRAKSLMTSPMTTNQAELAEPFEPSKRTVISKGGVLEFSDWEGEVEDMMVSALARLAQLAVDKAKKDSSTTAEEYYRRKLAKIINDPSQQFNAGNIDLSNVPLPSITVEHPIMLSPTRAEVRIMDLRVGQLEEKVERLMEFKEATIKVNKSTNSEIERFDKDADDEQSRD